MHDPCINCAAIHYCSSQSSNTNVYKIFNIFIGLSMCKMWIINLIRFKQYNRITKSISTIKSKHNILYFYRVKKDMTIDVDKAQ